MLCMRMRMNSGASDTACQQRTGSIVDVRVGGSMKGWVEAWMHGQRHTQETDWMYEWKHAYMDRCMDVNICGGMMEA
eukprot:364749-Chlamydomonas_euryale.AAC.3